MTEPMTPEEFWEVWLSSTIYPVKSRTEFQVRCEFAQAYSDYILASYKASCASQPECHGVTCPKCKTLIYGHECCERASQNEGVEGELRVAMQMVRGAHTRSLSSGTGRITLCDCKVCRTFEKYLVVPTPPSGEGEK